MVGAASFLLLFNTLYLVSALLQGQPPYAGAIAGLLYVGTLVLARKSASRTAPAMVLVASLTLALVGVIFSVPSSLGGFHAATMLLPALAVYLAGLRLGLVVTLFMCVTLGVLHPLYRSQAGPFCETFAVEQLWSSQIFAALSFLGAWGLGALHSTARDAAQATLERTLKVLGESESQLSSLIESTDDPVVSLDLQGRVLIANSAMKAALPRRHGRELQPGQIRSSGWSSRRSWRRGQPRPGPGALRAAPALRDGGERGERQAYVRHQPPPHLRCESGRCWD